MTAKIYNLRGEEVKTDNDSILMDKAVYDFGREALALVNIAQCEPHLLVDHAKVIQYLGEALISTANHLRGQKQ